MKYSLQDRVCWEEKAHGDQGEAFGRRLLEVFPHQVSTPLILYSSLTQSRWEMVRWGFFSSTAVSSV